MSTESVWLILLADILLLGALYLLGLSLAYWIDSRAESGVVPWIAFPLGAGVFSWILFLLSWMGIHHTLLTASIVYAVLMAPSLFILRRQAKEKTERGKGVSAVMREFRRSPPFIGLCAIGVLMFITSAVISIGLAYSTWDAIAIYASKGYGIALEGSVLAGKEWGALGLSRPMNVPILISLFRILDGDILPGSKLLYSLFFASLLGGTYDFWRSQRVEKSVAAFGTLFLGSLPIVFQHSTSGFTNLPFCVYLLLGALIGLTGIQRRDRARQRWSGLMLSMACWTRSEGAFLVPLLMLVLSLLLRSKKKGKVFLVDWISPVVVMLGLWFVFTQSHNGSFVVQHTLAAAFGSWRAFDFHFGAIYATLRYIGAQVLKVDSWGLIVPVVILIGLRNWRNMVAQRRPGDYAVLAMSFALGFSTLALYYLASFTRDLKLQLETSANRIILPTGILILVWVVMISATPLRDDKSLDQ